MNSLLVHNNNVANIENYTQRLKFISIEATLEEIIKRDFDIVYIKDSLSNNYMEFLGILLTYHIRLSNFDKRFVPIVIISDLDTLTLNKLNSLNNILFTKNIFLNNFKRVVKLDKNNFEKEFLDKISLTPPKDSSTNHDITNDWAIYQWSKLLDINTSLDEKISSSLYFKYLKAKYNLKEKTQHNINFKADGKVLLIDDRYKDGWGDIFKEYFKNSDIKLDIFKDDFKDKDFDTLKDNIIKKIGNFNPDLILLDLRLITEDNNINHINKISGIKILKEIKKLNKGTQVIIFTASSDSEILEEINKNDIVGYIKKDSPIQKYQTSKSSIKKLQQYTKEALSKSYLKEVYSIQQVLLKLDLNKNENYKKIKFEIDNIFDILNSNLDKKITFFILALYNIIEIINKEFDKSFGSAYNNIIAVCKEMKIDNIDNIDDGLSQIICTRNTLIHLGEIKSYCKGKVFEEPSPSKKIELLKTIKKLLINIKL